MIGRGTGCPVWARGAYQAYCRRGTSVKGSTGGSLAPAFLAIMLGLGLAGGCTRTVSPWPDLHADVQNAARIPLRIGVHYDDAFRSYEEAGDYCGLTAIFPLGQASMRLVDDALSTIAEDVVPVASLPLSAAQKAAVDIVMRPHFDLVIIDWPCDLTSPYSVLIRYELELLSPDGRLLDTWSVGGDAQTRLVMPSWAFTEDAVVDGRLRQPVDLALTDAARAMVARFERLAARAGSGSRDDLLEALELR